MIGSPEERPVEGLASSCIQIRLVVGRSAHHFDFKLAFDPRVLSFFSDRGLALTDCGFSLLLWFAKYFMFALGNRFQLVS